MEKLKLEDEYKLEDTVKLLKDRLKNNISQTSIQIINRRKRKLDELLNKTDYFSEEQIKMRDPILFDIYIGTYYKKHKVSQERKEFSMAKFYMDELEDSIHREKVHEEIEKEIKDYDKNNIKSEELAKLADSIENTLEDETDELMRLMMLKFLMGEDKDFIDYNDIDSNEMYDDVEQINREHEETYFESEEPSEDVKGDYTGIQDY